MGGLTSMSSAARIAGPLLAGAMYSGLGHAAPYWFGVVVIVVALFLVRPLLRAKPPSSNTKLSLATTC